MKAPAATAWQFSPLHQQLKWRSHGTEWLGQHAIVLTIEKVHPRGKNGKGLDCLAEQLVKPGGNGATPALDSPREKEK